MRLNQTVNDRFVLGRKLGEGSGGRLFEAFDSISRNSVAVKFMPPRTFEGDSFFGELVQDMKHEADILKEFSDLRGVPELIDVGEDVDGTPFIVMRKVEGDTLRDYAENGNSPMEVDTATSIVAQLCEILGDVHDRGYVHRDVKPENAMIDKSGDVHLIDFGIVLKVGEKPALASGTNRYAAPEQAGDSPAAPSADVFSLGYMLVEMATLTSPYPENYLMFVHRGAPPPEPDLSSLVPDLARVISEMVAWDPSRRPRDGGAAFRALRPFLPARGSPRDCKVYGADPTARYRAEFE